MTLKKPGDFFKTEDKNKVKMYSQSTSLPESYDEYKSNLKNIEVLADFTESVGTFKENAERINTLSTEIQNLQEQLSQFIKQEDLDRSTVSHLLFVEENIENIQQKIKGINSKTLHNIKEEFRGLQETVSEFIRLEVPSYKKQILETERRTDIRFIDLKNQIQKEVTSIDSHLTEKLSLISDTIENDYQNQIQNIHSLVKDFTEQEIPRYRGLITESKLQVEKDFITLEESIQNKIEEIDKSVSLAIEKSKEQNESNDKQLIELQQIIEDSRSQIDTISRTYENLHKDFRNREAHENQKLESYEGLLNNFSEKIDALENNLNDNVSLLHNDLNISTSKYYDILKKEVGSFEENISNKVKDLEVNIVVNEKHIHRIKDSVYEILDGLKLDLIEEKSQELTEKISHVERILEQFNERTLLNEGLLNEPPNVETSDPLTPLDQNYVTLPQLQEHYRIFINRIQQQLSTLGGGGAVRLDDLDDVDRTSAKTDGYVLAYQASTGKFIGTAVSGGGGGSQTLDTTLGLGNISSLGMSVGVVTATSFSGNINSSGISTLNNVVVGGATTALIVSGNARITGILTIGTSSITLDGTTDKITVGSGLTITSSEILIGSNIIDSGGLSGNASSATFATTAGIATFATTAGIATFATTAGIATFATTAGIATFATTAGIATFATTAGIATFATTAGIATFATTAGIATFATTAGIATSLQNSRIFEITGDIVASPISFDGTGNVSLAATIQPNSVELGTDTTGDYVQSVSGTLNQITVTSGTGEGSTPTLSIPNQFTVPQDIEVTRDLQVNRNLNVNGNITIGGTSATLFTSELKIYDPDIVLGFRTDSFGNDVSTDNTANHGGIAIASTEGNPLVQLFIAGIETNPATYKKIMWFKAGEFSGLGTDAWLSNYAVGIGSTQFPTGTRLAAGAVQFTERDLAVVRNINALGVVTATTFVGALTGTATSTTNIPNLTGDITSNNTTTTLVSVNSNVGTYGDAGAIPSITVNAKGLITGVTTVAPNNGQLSLAVSGTGLSGSATFTANQSGSSTFTVTSNATDANTSSTIVARDASGNFSAGTIAANLTGTATTATNLADATNITTGTINSARLSGTYNINVSYASTSGIATVAQGLTGTPNITVGIVTATSFVKSGGTSSQFLKADGSIDTNTYLTTTGSGTNLTGIVTSITAGSGISVNQSTGNVTITATGGGGIVIKDDGSLVGTAGTIDFGANLSVSFASGIATITGSSGGSQTLDTTLGLGNTSSFGMSVGVVTATSFSGSGTNLTGIVTSIVAGTNVTISGSTGQVTINATGGGGGGAAAALDILEVMLFA